MILISPSIIMSSLLLLVSLFLVVWLLLLSRRRKASEKTPPGSLGIPLIGQSLSLLWAMRANTAEKWMADRARRYGAVSKLSLFGKPTVFIYGQAANRFVFSSDGNKLSNQQTESVRMILGDRCLLELVGEDHKRIRDALASFLKPECLKNYIGKMEEEVRMHLQMHWHGKTNLKVLPLMKTLTFNIICSLLFGVERGAARDTLVVHFQEMIDGMWSVPLNLPFTRFNRSLKASTKVQKMLKHLLSEKRAQLAAGASPHQDLITCLLTIRGAQLVSDDEIIHNVMLIMVAGHDTSSVLITFMVRLLANHPEIHAALLREQEGINKCGDFLTWEDLGKMKYTWRVAMETLRTIPPLFGGFRKTLEGIEYQGYMIPKGWQILWVSAMTHMDDTIFPEASKFDPERFRNPAGVPPYTYIPFGGGARICPGYEFAKIETLLTIRYLVMHFTWKLGCNDDRFRRDPMPVPTQGLPIQIMPRNLL